MHGQRPPRAGLYRRRDVAGDGDAQTHVAGPAPAGLLDARGPVLRSGGLPHLEGLRALARSQCTLTCKWTYLAHERPSWQGDFLRRHGIADMVERGRLPETATAIGADLGPLTAEAAEALGLTTACRVGAGLIDAHAGALGVLGGQAGDPATLDRHLALIAGTSSCVMALSAEPRPTHGVWGPYYGAVLPDCWLNEGGQSATGALPITSSAGMARAGRPTRPCIGASPPA